MMIINSHIHCFLACDIPDKFLPLRLVRFIARQSGYEWLAAILSNINPFSSRDTFDRYLSFVQTGRMGSQKAVFQECAQNYPDDTKFICLSLDMAYMGAGNVPRDYSQQLIELKHLRDYYKENGKNNVIPFIHIDPRRPEYYELFLQAIEQWKFKGVKLYPPLGIFPYDNRLRPIYKYCQEKNIPVLAHCTAANPVFYKGKRRELLKLLENSFIKIDYKKSNKDLCSYFTHPAGWKYVMNEYPDLKICLAHFGRETEWDTIILEMMDRYDNLYADCSYTMADAERWPMMKVRLLTNPQLMDRLLFGSDFYMSKIECSEKQFCINFRCFLGEKIWRQITSINPEKFLNIS